MGIVKNETIDDQPVYSEKFYDLKNTLCGVANIVNEYKVADTTLKLAFVTYYDKYGKVLLFENYQYSNFSDVESVEIKVLDKLTRVSWILTVSTFPDFNKNELNRNEPKPNLGYFERFLDNTVFRNDGFKQDVIQRLRNE